MAEGKKGGALKIIIVSVVVLLIIIVGAGAMVKFDVFGLGSNVAAPIIKDIPVLKMVLPELAEEEEKASETAYQFETMEEAIEILKLTEKMLKETDEKAEKVSEQLAQSTAELERLKVFEANQLEFEKDKAAFDTLVATSTESIVFTEWYEKMYPENAAALYRDAVKVQSLDAESQAVIDIYQNMKSDQAAAILEGMAVTKLDQVSFIVKGLTAEQAGKVLGAMEPATAAKITTYISPE